MKSIKFGHVPYVPWPFVFVSCFAINLLPLITSGQKTFPLQTIATVTPITSPELRINEMNSRAARHFRDHFSDDRHEKWTRVGNYYVASFNDGSIPVKAYYNARGAFAQCVKSYTASLLNETIRLAIQKKFEGYTIEVVTEVSDLQQQFYFIKIKNSKNFKTIRVVDNTIEVIEDLAYIGN